VVALAVRAVAAAGVLGIIEKGASLEELPIAIQAVTKGRTYFSKELRQRIEEADGQGHGFGQAKLSPRESEVLRLLASGKSVGEVAELLSWSISTISRQKTDAMRKLGITSDADLFHYARDHGLL
jgi:two-component system, NarL family, captular synthesis response regulator RcsB